MLKCCVVKQMSMCDINLMQTVDINLMLTVDLTKKALYFLFFTSTVDTILMSIQHGLLIMIFSFFNNTCKIGYWNIQILDQKYENCNPGIPLNANIHEITPKQYKCVQICTNTYNKAIKICNGMINDIIIQEAQMQLLKKTNVIFCHDDVTKMIQYHSS